MGIFESIFFGLVQGFTEYLPVSSSAHLSVLFNLFGSANSGFNLKAFSVFLHFGTIIAALIVFWQDFAEIIFEIMEFIGSAAVQTGKRRRNFPAVRMLLMMGISMLPLILIIPLSGKIAMLFEKNAFIGIMLIGSGTVLYISDFLLDGSKTERNMSFSDAMILGLCQAVSAIPGFSRTGVAYTGGISLGLSREFSAKYAVMLSVPVMLGANLVRLFDAAELPFSLADVPMCLLGMAAAIVGGIISIRIFCSIAKNGKFRGIGYYCWVAGVLAIILTMIF